MLRAHALDLCDDVSFVAFISYFLGDSVIAQANRVSVNAPEARTS